MFVLVCKTTTGGSLSFATNSIAMNRKLPRSAPSTPADSSDIPFPQTTVSHGRPTNLDLLAKDTERGIRDLPVWKDLAKRVGLIEARKILRQGLKLRLLTDGNPQN